MATHILRVCGGRHANMSKIQSMELTLCTGKDNGESQAIDATCQGAAKMWSPVWVQIQPWPLISSEALGKQVQLSRPPFPTQKAV